jgi:hypothetical protein
MPTRGSAVQRLFPYVRRSLRVVGTVGLTVFATGCFNNNIGYLQAGHTYGEIAVGKPRVSTRERLINDRLEEDAWLKSQLRDTDNKIFGVQGKSDIRSFSGLVARAGVQADIRQIKAYREQEDQQLEDLQRQRELRNLDYQLALQRKQKDLADAAADPSKAQSQYYGSIGGPSQGTPPKPPATSGDAAAKTLGDLSTAIQSLNGQLNALSGRPDDKKAEPTVASVTASPIEEFRERLAYREEIRSELIQNALDDAHDLNGNTLYRLSFDTAVVPDSDTSAWAVITVTVGVASGQVDPTPEQFAQMVNQRIEAEATEVGLAIQDVCRDASSKETAIACIKRVRPETLAKLQRLTKTSLPGLFALLGPIIEVRRNNVILTDADARGIVEYLAQVASGPNTVAYNAAILGKGGVEATRRKIQADLLPGENGSDDFLTLPRNAPPGKALKCMLNDNKRLLGFGVNVRIAGGMIEVTDPDMAKLTILNELYGARVRDRQTFDLDEATSHRCAVAYIDARDEVDEGALRASRVSAYGATPKESVQRISEVLSRREASEFAFALQAVTGAAAIDSVLNYIKSNDALFHALRRQPLVLGFAGNPKADSRKGKEKEAADDPSALNTSASFGWIIGPKYEIRNTLFQQQAGFRHVPIQNNVAGVISVPAHWKDVDLRIEKCWKSEAGSYAECRAQTASVSLPAEPARAFDLQKDIGRRITLSALTPDSYSVRPGQSASLVIRGENLWRNATVLLGGQEADRISVLPDMGGIVAYFKQVQPSSLRRQTREATVELVVATSEGYLKVADVAVQSSNVPRSVQWGIVGNHIAFPSSKLTLRPNDRLPSAFFELAVALANQDKRSDAVTVNEPKSIEYLESENSIRIAVPPSFSGWDSGNRIGVSTLMKKFPGDNEPEKQNVGTLVYYASKEDSQATYKFSSKDNKTYTAEILLPLGAKYAYPNLPTDTFPVQVTAKGKNGELPQQIGVCVVSQSKGRDKCTVSVTFPSEATTVALQIGNGDQEGFPEARQVAN